MVLVTYVLPFVGVLLALVVLHELGHYVAAKLAGVRVEEFGIGLPPRIGGKQFGETLYSINWLPIGGFVRLTGEESSGVIVERVSRGNSANSSLHPGDRLTHVNGKRVNSPQQFAERMAEIVNGTKLEYSISRSQPNGGRKAYVLTLTSLDDSPISDRAIAADPAAVPGAMPAVDRDDPNRTTFFGVTVGGDPGSLAVQGRFTRIGILAAGAAVNAVLPIFLFALGAIIPDNISAGPAVVTTVVQGAPAQRAGIESGDYIVAVNGDEIRNAQDLTRAIQLNLGKTITATIERNTVVDSFTGETATERFDLDVHARLAPQPLTHVVQQGESIPQIAERLGVPALFVIGAWGVETRELAPGTVLNLPGGRTYTAQPDDTIASIAVEQGIRVDALYYAVGLDPRFPPAGTVIEVRQGATGITVGNASSRVVRDGASVAEAIPEGWDQTVATFVLVRNRIRSWIAGGEAIDLSGPVGIARVTGEVIERAGWLRLIELAALLSLNLAIINILPLPMLDGGRIFFVLVEIARRGKRISPEREGLVHLAGFVALLLFIVVISYFDIVKAISGESLLE